MIELGLQRISRLLARTPLPWHAIHVAGTNGKGSICASVSAMLDAYNKSAWREHHGQTPLKHARFNSPHLIDRWDCITINQQTVQKSLFQRVEEAVLARNQQLSIDASEFELLTATAFEIFTREAVNVAVVEVGLGGRLDATNIIGQTESIEDLTLDSDLREFRQLPLVTAISRISLDHQSFLGNTLSEIATEKAGILKPGVPYILDPSHDHDDVAATIRTAADGELSREIHSAVDYFTHCGPLGLARQPARAPLSQNLYVAFWTALTALNGLGRVPALSSMGAPTLTRVACGGHLHPFLCDLEAAAEAAKVPGRTQRLSIKALTGRGSEVLLDGAHNKDAAELLGGYARAMEAGGEAAWEEGGPVVWVMAASDTKDVREILRPLLKEVDKLVVVEFGPVDGMPWVKPMAAEGIQDAALALVPGLDVRCLGKDVLGGLKEACALAGEGKMVVAGSLYLVGDVLRLLRDHGGGSEVETEEQEAVT